MPVYHETLHAYRSWRADHRRGYTKRGKGYQLPDPETAKEWDKRAKLDPARFEELVQKLIILIAYDFCVRRKMKLHAVGNEDGHTHLVVSWREYRDCDEVIRRLKNVLATALNKYFGTRGKRWFVRGSSRKRVRDKRHLSHLMDRYLPDHPGILWREGIPLPQLP